MDSLLNKFRSANDEDDKIELIQSVFELHENWVVDLLIEGMGDSSWRVRKTAIEGITNYYDPYFIIDKLVYFLHEEENANLRNSTIEALERLGRFSRNKLVLVLEKEDDETKKFIVDILGEIGDDKTVDELVKFIDTDDVNLITAIIETIGKIGGKNRIDLLVDYLKRYDGNTNVVFACILAIKNLCIRYNYDNLDLTLFVKYFDMPLLKKAFLDLAGYVGKEKVLDYILSEINNPGKGTRESAIKAVLSFYLRYPDKSDILVEKLENADIKKELLYKSLSSSNSDTKKGTILILSIIGDVDSFQKVVRNIGDDKEFYLDIFTKFYGKELSAVINQICYDFDENTMAFLCLLLGRLGSRDSESLLLKLIKGSDILQKSAAKALENVASTDAIAVLTKMLSHTDSTEIAENLISTLSKVGKDNPREFAKSIEENFDRCITNRCKINFIVLIGEVKLVEYWRRILIFLKDPDYHVRKSAIRSLRKLNVKESFFQLQPLCFDDNDEVRIEAVKAIAVVGGENALDSLLVLKEDPYFWVRMESLKSLEVVLGDKVVDYLDDKINDPIGAVSIVALEILSRHWNDKYSDFLLKGLRHKDIEVVHTAVELMVKFKICSFLQDNYFGFDKEEKQKIIKSLYHCKYEITKKELIKELYEKEEDEEIKKAWTGLFVK